MYRIIILKEGQAAGNVFLILFVYFMQWRPLLLETASAGFSPIGGQPA
jgi:hypothetical protein